MKHEKIKEYFLLYLDNELSDLETKNIEAHLNMCPECQQEIELLRSVWNKKTAIKKPSPFLFTRVEAEMASDKEHISSKVWVPKFAAVASILICLFLGVLFGNNIVVTDSVNETETYESYLGTSLADTYLEIETGDINE